MQVVGALGTLDPESPNESLLRLRVYAGYAGWGPNQLDGELEQDAWLVAPAEADDPFSEEDLWSRALKRRGGAYRLLATMPPDPSQN
jgi:putative transcriptional regulator